MSKLPLEILKEKYIPVVDFPEKYGISVAKVMRLVNSHKVRYAEFKSPNSNRSRIMHVNPEDVLPLLEKEDEHESNSSI